MVGRAMLIEDDMKGARNAATVATRRTIFRFCMAF
jgi:hypothetical protein